MSKQDMTESEVQAIKKATKFDLIFHFNWACGSRSLLQSNPSERSSQILGPS